MGKYPVVSVSLKSINAASYETAFALAVQIINEAAAKVQYLLDSDRLTEYDKAEYRSLLDKNMSEAALFGSLKKLSDMLEKHHGTKVILLIDEYDVPLAKAFDNGYYERMVFLVRNLLERALKTNSSLKFAVLTGCMRINMDAPSSLGSKTPRQVSEVGLPARLENTSPSIHSHSIFTGLNNFKVLTIADTRFDEYFGFTDEEVKSLLAYYGKSQYYDAAKEWYDGYHFGNVNVYCPWDVLNYCDSLLDNPDAQPQNYWINTSSNDAVKKFIRHSRNRTTKREIESLVAGEAIIKEIHQELTYKEMYASIDNIWSVLFTTGYLTQRGKSDGKQFRLVIPNLEIRDIFTTQIMAYFKEGVKEDGETLNRFCDALLQGDAPNVERIFTEYLKKTISIRDTAVRKEMKENFYHGILIGILGIKDSWGVSSNHEMGVGYGDILVEPDDDIGIILEIKYARDGKLDAACDEALKQIEKTKYEDDLADEGVSKILKYGIACYKKQCKVMLAPTMF